MPSDFDMLAQMGPAGGGDSGPGQDVQQALAPRMDSFRQLGAASGAAYEAAAKPVPPSSLKVNTEKGTVDISGLSMETYQGFLRDRAQLDQIRGSFAQEAERLRQREDQLRNQSPWIQLATALAANMAQAKDLPGWVQAAGRTSAQLNPQPDEIRNQRLGVLSKEAEMTEKSAGLNIAQARTLQDAQGRQQSMVQHTEEQRLKQVEQATDNLSQSVGKGPGELDVKAAAAVLDAAGATPKERDVKLQQLQILAKNVSTKYQRESEKQVADALAKEKAETGRNERFLTSQEGIAERARLAQAGQDTRQADRLAQQEFTTSNAAYNRTTSLSPAEQTAVEGAFKTLNLVDKLDALDKSGKKGPITGTIQYLNPWRNAEWQQIMNYSDQLLLSGLNGKLGSGVSDMDVKVMRGVMPSGKMTQEQYDATVKVLRTLSPENLERLMTLNPNIQYWKNTKPLFEKFGMGSQYERGMEQMKASNAAAFPELFGPDRPKIADRIFGADTKFEGEATTSAPAPGAKDSGGPHNKTTKSKYPWEK